VYPNLQIYLPPNPDEDELYIPPIDDMDYLGVYPYYLPLLSPKRKRARERKLVKEKATDITQTEEEFDEELEGRKKVDVDAESDYTPMLDEEDNKKRKKEKQEKKKKEKKQKEKEKSSTKLVELNKANDPKKDKQKKRKTTGTKPSDKKALEELVDQEFSYTSPWTTEEDIALVDGKVKFGLNWDIICDIVTAVPKSVTKKRSRKQCMDRWRVLSQGKEDFNKSMLPTVQSTPSEGQSQQYQYTILDVIKRTVQKKKQIPGRIGTVAQSESLVPVTTHTSHAQAAVTVGINSTSKPRNPLEIATNAILKIQRIQKEQSTPIIVTTNTKLNQNLDTKLAVAPPTAPIQPPPSVIPLQSNTVVGHGTNTKVGTIPNTSTVSPVPIPVNPLVSSLPMANAHLRNQLANLVKPNNATPFIIPVSPIVPKEAAHPMKPVTPFTGTIKTLAVPLPHQPTHQVLPGSSVILSTTGSQTSRLAQINQVVGGSSPSQPTIIPTKNLLLTTQTSPLQRSIVSTPIIQSPTPTVMTTQPVVQVANSNVQPPTPVVNTNAPPNQTTNARQRPKRSPKPRK